MSEQSEFIAVDEIKQFSDRKPFQKQYLDEEKKEEKGEIITVRLNKEERELLDIDKKALQQPKDSTAIKQMIDIARFVLHQSEMGKISRLLLANVRRNVRIGINEYEGEFSTNVKQNL